VLAAVITAEIAMSPGSRTRPSCAHGPADPRHRESDTKVARGHVTEQGSRLLRWALIEAIQRIPKDSVIGGVKDAIIARRGRKPRHRQGRRRAATSNQDFRRLRRGAARGRGGWRRWARR